MNGRRGGFWVLLVVAVVVAVVLVGGRSERRDGTPYAPRGTGSLGFGALLELADSYGADVDVVDGYARADADIAVLADDELNGDDTDRLAAWVERGGTLVVIDPTSRFVPDAAAPVPVTSRDVVAGRCTVGALDGLTRLRVAGGAFTLPVPAGATSCFGDGSRAVVVVRDRGQGTLVTIGGPSPFVNANLAEADNARLAVTLLAPAPGTRVDFVRGASYGRGDETVWALIRPGVRFGLLQLALAVVVYAAFRARRLGRPVSEVPPVQIEGSELVDAVGRLLARTRSPAHAAWVLRSEARRELARDVGLSAGGAGHVAPEQLATVIAARLGGGAEGSDTSAAHIAAVLADRPITDDAQLLVLARQLHTLRQEVRGVRQ